MSVANVTSLASDVAALAGCPAVSADFVAGAEHPRPARHSTAAVAMAEHLVIDGILFGPLVLFEQKSLA